MEYLLETKQLTKVYGNRPVVNRVDLHINKGDIYGLIGKNGAGKTTIMRMVLSLAFPTGGEIYLFGKKSNGRSDRRIASLIEAPGIYRNLSAKDNMEMFSTLYGTDFSEIDSILEYVGLGETGDKKAGSFSLGMKQRLGIAIALLGNPEFVVLDEPVNGLDPAGMKDVRDLIVRLNKEKGVTFMISSHLLDELSKMVNKYAILNDGRLVEEITVEELEQRCRHKLIITVDDPQRATDILATTVPREDLVCADDKLIVTSHTEQSGRINRLLVEGGLTVSELQIKSDGIEQYFVQRIGG